MWAGTGGRGRGPDVREGCGRCGREIESYVGQQVGWLVVVFGWMVGRENIHMRDAPPLVSHGTSRRDRDLDQ